VADTPEQERAEAAASIQEDGAPFQLRRVPRAYNPATSKVEEGALQTHDSYAADWAYKTRDIDGTLVLRGDVRLIVAALDASGAELPAPVNGDTALYAGDCLNVIGTEAIRKAGVAITYVVQLRKP
jgi:hypothetical protein